MTNSHNNIHTGRWILDASHSEIGFSVRHAGISKVRGRFTDAVGVVQIANNFDESFVEVVIDAKSFNSGNEGRDNHVRSADFFDVEQFSTITFDSKKITHKHGDKYVLDGVLTIRGVQKDVSLHAELEGIADGPDGTPRAGLTAETEISRKEFSLTWNVALEAGGVLVSDKVKINLDLAFTFEDSEREAANA